MLSFNKSPTSWRVFILAWVSIFSGFATSSAYGQAAQAQVAGIDAPQYLLKGPITLTGYLLSTGPSTLHKTMKAGGGLAIFPAPPDQVWAGESYVVIHVSVSQLATNDKTDVLLNSPDFINANDNNLSWCLKRTDFDALLKQGTIVPLHVLSIRPTLDYGAKVSLPFKLRFRVRDELSGKLNNIRITPDITLGGYLGPRWRINPSKEHYLRIPLSAGLATLMLNDNTLKGNNSTTGTTAGPQEDGLVLGVTTSTGLVATFDGFEIGALTGFDYAAGEIGSNWLYNGKPWVSFSIGYSFLGKDK